MTGHHRAVVAALVLFAVLAGVLLVVFAGTACPGTPGAASCPGAATNRAIVIALVASAVALLVTPFAFLAEVVLRRRIVYRGAWGRAARRGLLAAAVVASLAGLRLGGALSVPVAIFVAVLAALVEWLAVRRFDLP